jgi:alpha-beta hydrolase superfamily lysophospholipase
VVLKEESLKFFHSIKGEDKQIEMYPNFYHEILNETGRQEVFERIGGWIAKRI